MPSLGLLFNTFLLPGAFYPLVTSAFHTHSLSSSPASLTNVANAPTQPYLHLRTTNSRTFQRKHSLITRYERKFKIDRDRDDDEGLMESATNEQFTAFGAEAVPEGQRPANEYINLISSPLFDWANRPSGDSGLAKRLGILYVTLFALVSWPISGATFTQEGFVFHKLLCSHIGAFGVVMLLLIRLYSGWGYVGTRLQSKTIEYEETGWYDGDIEEKTDQEKARDMFLYNSNVRPVVERLKAFTLGAGAFWLASCVGLNILFQVQPMFNEYDPDMLKQLQADDKIADVAAQQSNGRPTYCDNRYYRAVANGGQGCN